MFFNVFSERMVCSICGMNVRTPGNSEIAILKDLPQDGLRNLRMCVLRILFRAVRIDCQRIRYRFFFPNL